MESLEGKHSITITVYQMKNIDIRKWQNSKKHIFITLHRGGKESGHRAWVCVSLYFGPHAGSKAPESKGLINPYPPDDMGFISWPTWLWLLVTLGTTHVMLLWYMHCIICYSFWDTLMSTCHIPWELPEGERDVWCSDWLLYCIKGVIFSTYTIHLPSL